MTVQIDSICVANPPHCREQKTRLNMGNASHRTMFTWRAMAQQSHLKCSSYGHLYSAHRAQQVIKYHGLKKI